MRLQAWRGRVTLLRAASVLLVLLIAGVLPFLVPGYVSFQFSSVLFYAVALLGLTIITGRAGLVSIGHGAFFGIGAYTVVILVSRWSVPYGLTLPAAAILTFLLGALFGLPVIRLSRNRQSMVILTLALAIAFPQVVKRFSDFTGGTNGVGIPKPDAAFGLPLTGDQWLYFLCLFVMLVMFLVGWNLLRGRIGRAFVAMRDHEIAAGSMGVDVGLYKLMAFAFGSMYAGVAGALYALVIQFVNPDSFSIILSITFVTGVIVGGINSLFGALLGALFIEFVPVFVSDFAVGHNFQPSVIYGAVLILVVFLMPDGIAGLFRPDVPAFKRIVSRRLIRAA